MNYLISAIIAAVISIGSLFVPVQTKSISFGSFNPSAAGTQRLQSSIGGSDTSLTLVSFKEPVSNIKYTMSYLNSSLEYATIEPQSSGKEFISFTGITQNADGSATLTGLTRGLGFSYPYTASTTLQQPHPGQSILILSNPPQLYNQYGALANAQTWAGINTFTLSPIVPTPTTATQAANKSYVDGVALVSAPNADTVTKGVVQLATGLQAASSTSLGSTGAALVLSSSMATDTPNTATRDSKVLMSQIGGFLNQAWLDLSATWQFTGAVSIPASISKPFTLNSLAYTFNSGRQASSTVLMEDGSGNLSFNSTFAQKFYLSAATPVMSSGQASTTLLSATVPAGTLGASNAISCQFYIGRGSAANTAVLKLDVSYGGNATSTLRTGNVGGGSGNVYTDIKFLLSAAGTTSTQKLSLRGGVSNDATPDQSGLDIQESTPNIDSTLSQKLYVVGAYAVANGSLPAGQVVCTLIR